MTKSRVPPEVVAIIAHGAEASVTLKLPRACLNGRDLADLNGQLRRHAAPREDGTLAMIGLAALAGLVVGAMLTGGAAYVFGGLV